MSFEMGRVIGTSLKIDFSHSVEMTPDIHRVMELTLSSRKFVQLVSTKRQKETFQHLFYQLAQSITNDFAISMG